MSSVNLDIPSCTDLLYCVISCPFLSEFQSMNVYFNICHLELNAWSHQPTQSAIGFAILFSYAIILLVRPKLH